jgi:lysophospholipase L1-like esterase
MRTLGLAFALATILQGGCNTYAEASQLEEELSAAAPPRYLALGDSVAFGYQHPLYPPKNTLNVFVGYPSYLNEMVDIPVVNASCPGETSGSFISPLEPDHGCRDFKAAFGLHTSYSGTQLDFALGYLQDNPGVRLVTVALGANDLFILLESCMGDMSCVMANLPATLQNIGQNMAVILGTLRWAGYQQQIIVPLYYARSYTDPVELATAMYLNQVLSQVAAMFGAQVSDTFSAFGAASAAFGGDPCAAGLMAAYPDGSCDQHPSYAGQQVMAAAAAQVVNRTW